MAVVGAWINGFISVNGVQLSDHAREISLDIVSAELPADVMGTQTASVRAGLQSWTVAVTFLQDFAAASVDNVLYSAGGQAGHTPFNIEVGPNSVLSVSATNPRYSGLAVLASYKPFGGAHGANMEAVCTFRCAADLTKRTA
jgi:hypothetical protein